MSRRKLEPKVPLKVRLPVALRAELDLLLVSDLQGRVPHGDYSEFFERRLREWLSDSVLDLTPYGLPLGTSVRGPKHCIDALRARLDNNHPSTRRNPRDT